VFTKEDASMTGWTQVLNKSLENQENAEKSKDYINQRNGFGDLSSGDFWLGLENIRILTTQKDRMQLRFEAILVNGTHFYNEYESFHVSSEADDYVFRLGPKIRGGSLDFFQLLNNSNIFKYTCKDEHCQEILKHFGEPRVLKMLLRPNKRETSETGYKFVTSDGTFFYSGLITTGDQELRQELERNYTLFTSRLPKSESRSSLRKIILNKGVYINGIQLSIEDSNKNSTTNSSYLSDFYGSQEGDQFVWEVPAGECITRVDVSFDAFIRSLRFITNKGTDSGRIGSEGHLFRSVQLDGCLVGIQGLAGLFIYQIRFISI
jgi:hypothetical protein